MTRIAATSMPERVMTRDALSPGERKIIEMRQGEAEERNVVRYKKTTLSSSAKRPGVEALLAPG